MSEHITIDYERLSKDFHFTEQYIRDMNKYAFEQYQRYDNNKMELVTLEPKEAFTLYREQHVRNTQLLRMYLQDIADICIAGNVILSHKQALENVRKSTE